MTVKQHAILLALFLFLTVPATAHVGEGELNHTKEIIASNTPCSELSEDEIANIGDYYMEQMHPGEMHDIMDEHMGGQGSESLRQAHIAMGQEYYCDSSTGEASSSQWGWMPMMGGMWGSGMWGMGTMGWFGMLIWLGILVLILLGIIYLIKLLTEQRERPETQSSGDDGE